MLVYRFFIVHPSSFLLMIIHFLFRLALLPATMYALSVIRYREHKNVTITCRYAMYACGDCYPQYNVLKVKPTALTGWLKGKDVDVVFANAQQEKEFHSKESKFFWLNDSYVLTGDLYFSARKWCYVLDLKRYKIQRR